MKSDVNIMFTSLPSQTKIKSSHNEIVIVTFATDTPAKQVSHVTILSHVHLLSLTGAVT